MCIRDRLNTYTFPSEAKFKDEDYAKRSYQRLDVYKRQGYDIDDGSVEEIAISILSLMISIKNNKVIEK